MPADIEHIKGKLIPVKGENIEDIAAAGLHIELIRSTNTVSRKSG